jgi:hypothetical protein
MRRIYLALVFAGLVFVSQEASAQVCRPVAQRNAELGCWIVANSPVGQLTKPEVFWHLDTYTARAEAEAAKTPTGIVVESLGKTWLFTIADKGWRPSGGERVAEIGPLPVTAGEAYSAQYMEAVFAPGMTAPSHTHAGPEAWYTVSGETCLENIRWQAGGTGWRRARHRAGRAADAPHRDRNGDAPGAGVDPA